jgi:hypothetical protein
MRVLFFGMAKGTMRDREFQTVQDILGRLTEIWNDLIFEDVQSVFLEWQIGLNWVIENGGEYYSEQSKKNENLLWRHSEGILSARLIWHPVLTGHFICGRTVKYGDVISQI